MKIKVMNKIGQGKEIKIGFSWTMFFFGIFVPIFRADWKWFIILIVANALFSPTGYAFIPSLIFCFFYNKLYARDLYNAGYRGMTEEEDQIFLNYI